MRPNKIDLIDLIDHTDDLCVSIYMPTHEVHIEQQKADAVQLRDLIDQARLSIKEKSRSINYLDIEGVLEPAIQLLERDGDFWKHQHGGLAIFMSEGFNRVFSLPFMVKPRVVVAERFYIRPLLSLSASYNRFYILALSKNQVQLFLATETMIEEIELQGMPASLSETLADDNLEKQFQFHGAASAPGAPGKRSAIFYSHGIRKNSEKVSLLHYCQQIDTGLHPYLHSETAPLVLACVDYLFAIYKKANTYPHLFPYCVSGSPDRLSQTLIHDKALKVVQPDFNQTKQSAVDELLMLIGQGQIFADVASIVPAAFQGRVDKLFMVEDHQKYGCFDEVTGKVELCESAQIGCQELMNLAAIYTLNNDGEVYNLRPDELPGGIEIAATLRYIAQPLTSISRMLSQ